MGLAYLHFQRYSYCQHRLPSEVVSTYTLYTSVLQKEIGYYLLWMEPGWWNPQALIPRRSDEPRRTPKSPLEVFLDLQSVVMEARSIRASKAVILENDMGESLARPNLGIEGQEADVILAYQGMKHLYNYASKNEYNTIKWWFETLPDRGITEEWIHELCSISHK